MREQVEGYRRYALRIEGASKTGSASELLIVSHQLGLLEKEHFHQKRELARLRKALEFYTARKDDGQIARAALDQGENAI